MHCLLCLHAVCFRRGCSLRHRSHCFRDIMDACFALYVRSGRNVCAAVMVRIPPFPLRGMQQIPLPPAQRRQAADRIHPAALPSRTAFRIASAEKKGTVNTYGFCAAAQRKHPGTKCSLNRAFLLMFQSDRLTFLSIWLYTFIIACLPVIVKNRSRNLRNTQSGLYFLPSNISDQKPHRKVTRKFGFF